MNSRSTWFLLLTALALGGYLYLSGPRPGAPTSPSLGGYAPVVATEVTAIEFLRSNAVMRVERTTNGWRLTLPVQYGAQGSAVDAFLESLARMRPRTFIPPGQIEPVGSTNSWKAFGLGESALTVKLESAAGPAALFKLGGPAPLEGQFYFQRVGADGIFTADDTFMATLPRTADSWRDRGLFDLSGMAHDRVEVRGKPSFVAEKDDKTGAWRLTKPLAARADGERIESLLNALQRVRVAAFVNDLSLVDPGPLGLEPAETELIVGRGTNDLVRLQFGRSPTNAQEFVFVRRMANTNVVLAPVEAAQLVRLPLANFRNRQLVPDLAGANQLEFGAGTNRTLVERRGTNWMIAGNPPLSADPELVTQVLAQLAALPIVDFPNDVPADLSRYGLDHPQREWGVKAGTNEIVRLAFGAQDGLDKVFVRRADEMPVYSMPLYELLRLPDSASLLRLLRFDSSNVVQLTVIQKGRTNVVTRGSDGNWQPRPATPDLLFDASLSETLHRIGHLESARYPLPPAKRLELLKFPETDHTLIMQLDPGAALNRLTLQFGGPTPLNNVYAIARCDADERGFLFEFPGPLYLDVIRDLSIP